MKCNSINIVISFSFFLIFFLFYIYYSTQIEHEKTIQKAIECGYEPIVIDDNYWNKGN